MVHLSEENYLEMHKIFGRGNPPIFQFKQTKEMIKTDDYRMALNLINNALHQINIAVYQVEEDLDADEVVFRIVKDESIEADLVDATKHLMDAKDKLKAILNLD